MCLACEMDWLWYGGELAPLLPPGPAVLSAFAVAQDGAGTPAGTPARRPAAAGRPGTTGFICEETE